MESTGPTKLVALPPPAVVEVLAGVGVTAGVVVVVVAARTGKTGSQRRSFLSGVTEHTQILALDERTSHRAQTMKREEKKECGLPGGMKKWRQN